MDHISDDILSVLIGLCPGHLYGGGSQSLSLHTIWHTGKPVGPEHGEAGAGLGGACTVLSNALVNGLVVLADAVDGQCAVTPTNNGFE